jgi:hypothetical protein
MGVDGDGGGGGDPLRRWGYEAAGGATGTFATTERAWRDEATKAEGVTLAEMRSWVARSGARATRRIMVVRILPIPLAKGI